MCHEIRDKGGVDGLRQCRPMRELTLHQQEQTWIQVLNSELEHQLAITPVAEIMVVSERHTKRLLAAAARTVLPQWPIATGDGGPTILDKIKSLHAEAQSGLIGLKGQRNQSNAILLRAVLAYRATPEMWPSLVNERLEWLHKGVSNDVHIKPLRMRRIPLA